MIALRESKHAKRVTTLDPVSGERVLKAFPASRDKLEIVGNGVDGGWFATGPRPAESSSADSNWLNS